MCIPRQSWDPPLAVRSVIFMRLLEACQTFLSSLPVIRNSESMGFVVREQNILFVRLDGTRVPDEAFGLVELVFYDTDYGDEDAGILKHPLCRANLRFTPVNREHARQ